MSLLQDNPILTAALTLAEAHIPVFPLRRRIFWGRIFHNDLLRP
jgi:hypothetical protein